jgi:hypothetical protein
MPVLVVAQEETLPVSVQRGVQEQAYQLEVPHFFEPAICGLHRAPHDSESAAFHFLTQKVIFRIECLLVKCPQRMELGSVEKHVHACTERFVEPRELLHEVISVIERPIPSRAARTNDVRGHTMKIPSPG